MTDAGPAAAPGPPSYRAVVAEARPELDERLSDELDRVNVSRPAGV